MQIKTYFAGQPIPENEKYAYIVAKDGYYVLKKNNVFESCTKIDAIPDLSEQEETFDLKAKKIPYSLIKEVLAFFYEVFKQYKSEAMVLLCYSEDNWSLVVPDQEVAGASVKYSNNHKHVVGSIHSHPGFGAFASGTDERDEVNFDGIHIIISKFDEVKPELSCYVVINGRRAMIEPERVLENIAESTNPVNQEWLKKVKPLRESLFEREEPHQLVIEEKGAETNKDKKVAEEEDTVPVGDPCVVCSHEEVCIQDMCELGRPCQFFDYDKQRAAEYQRFNKIMQEG